MEDAGEHGEQHKLAHPSRMKVCVVTGANTGIGKETAKGMVQAGYRVVLACRSLDRAKQAQTEIINETAHNDDEEDRGEDGEKESSTCVMQLDLADLESVKQFVTQFHEDFASLDVLILNAGVTTASRQETKQGHEMMFGVNHLGHFLLTNLLLDVLRKTPSSRIVVVASDAHKFSGALTDTKQLTECPPFANPGTALAVYARSKLCNMLFTIELSKRLKEEAEKNGTHLVTVNALHPGAVNTELQREAPWYLAWLVKPLTAWFFKTPTDGAKTSIYVALSDDVKDVTGKYFADEKESKPVDYALDMDAAKMLWDLSEELTA